MCIRSNMVYAVCHSSVCHRPRLFDLTFTLGFHLFVLRVDFGSIWFHIKTLLHVYILYCIIIITNAYPICPMPNYQYEQTILMIHGMTHAWYRHMLSGRYCGACNSSILVYRPLPSHFRNDDSSSQAYHSLKQPILAILLSVHYTCVRSNSNAQSSTKILVSKP